MPRELTPTAHIAPYVNAARMAADAVDHIVAADLGEFDDIGYHLDDVCDKAAALSAATRELIRVASRADHA